MSKESTALVPTINPIELNNKLTTISSQVSSLPSINSDDDYDQAYNIRAKIKSAIKWISSVKDPEIDLKHKAHKAALAEKRKLVKPFDELDSQLDSMMSQWNKKKKEEAERLRLERDKDLLEISEAILFEDDNTIESSNSISGVDLSSLLPAYVPEKPRGERTYKKIKITDPSKFNKEFIIFLLSDPDIQDTICTWLKKQSKLLGGFEALLNLAGEGSIEEVSEESISIR